LRLTDLIPASASRIESSHGEFGFGHMVQIGNVRRSVPVELEGVSHHDAVALNGIGVARLGVLQVGAVVFLVCLLCSAPAWFEGRRRLLAVCDWALSTPLQPVH